MNKPVRVLITDDHPIYRKAAAALLECHPEFEVVGFCDSGPETIEKVPAIKPDIVLMDVHMQPMDGIETTSRIIAIDPTQKIIGFSLETRPVIAERMFQAGARGYVTKSSPKEEICEAIRLVMKGKKYKCQEIRKINE
jgi:two-component system invasion response regulator UvrY